jgi:hypothetical protein
VPHPARRPGRIGRSVAAAVGLLGTLALLAGAALLTGLASLTGGALPTASAGVGASRLTAPAPTAGRSTTSGDVRSAAPGQLSTRTPAALAPSTSAAPRAAGVAAGDLSASCWRDRDARQPHLIAQPGMGFATSGEAGPPGVRAPPAGRTA